VKSNGDHFSVPLSAFVVASRACVMGSAADPRREVGARVQKPHFLTLEAQAQRYFGTAPKTTLVPGTVLAVEKDSSARALIHGYLTRRIPVRSVTFQGLPDSNTAPNAGTKTNPAPAVAVTVDEDASRRQEENQACSGPECRTSEIGRQSRGLHLRMRWLKACDETVCGVMEWPGCLSDSSWHCRRDWGVAYQREVARTCLNNG
jgi:hypothetical protein